MNPIIFWRTEPLTAPERHLLDELAATHYASCFRENASSVNVSNSAIGSGDYTKAIAAGLMSIGGLHAPIMATMHLLNADDPVKLVNDTIARKGRVPGWGNSFIKDVKDELWLEVESAIYAISQRLTWVLEAVTAALHNLGKNVFPNPSAYTAAAAIILGVPPPIAPMLFVQGRLAGWSELVHMKFSGR